MHSGSHACMHAALHVGGCGAGRTLQIDSDPAALATAANVRRRRSHASRMQKRGPTPRPDVAVVRLRPTLTLLEHHTSYHGAGPRNVSSMARRKASWPEYDRGT